MAAPMVAGAAALSCSSSCPSYARPGQGLLMDSDRPLTDTIDELSLVDAARRVSTTAASSRTRPHARTSYRPGHRRDRLHALELEPVELEHRLGPAAVELEPVELEHGSGRAARRGLQRHRRPPVELEPVELEPLQLVDELDQVIRMSTGGTAADRAADTPCESCRT